MGSENMRQNASMSITPPDSQDVPQTAPRVSGSEPAPQPKLQTRNPLHGLTLEAIVIALQAHYGWPGLAQRIPIRCFASDPSVASSLKFLRKTPWAREKVEGLYLYMGREQKRSAPVAPAKRKYGAE
jgi:DNA-binding protein VF530